MNPRTWMLLPLLLLVERPHPDDAKRYVVVMRALYQNQQRECGYFDPLRGGGSFVYPHGMIDIPNESRDSQHARFNIYLDRYNRNTCNWELASPSFLIRDTYTGRDAFGNWGLREDRVPGTKYKAICLFKATDLPQNCYGRWPLPDKPHYSRIPITVQVSEDSAPMRPHVPGYFSSDRFVKPVIPNDALSPSSSGGTH